MLRLVIYKTFPKKEPLRNRRRIKACRGNKHVGRFESSGILSHDSKLVTVYTLGMCVNPVIYKPIPGFPF